MLSLAGPPLDSKSTSANTGSIANTNFLLMPAAEFSVNGRVIGYDLVADNTGTLKIAVSVTVILKKKKEVKNI